MSKLSKQFNFEKYESMENHYREKIVALIKKEKTLMETKWVGTEKIHGCNFQIICNEKKELCCGKRGSLLGSNATFYLPVKDIIEKRKEKMFQIYDILGGKPFALYGELFGGIYEHSDVKRNDSVKKVQKGIYYSPNIEFIAFDIKTEGRFLGYEEFQKVCEKVNLFYSKPVIIDTFENVMKFDVENFESTISDILKLPKIPGNYAEGIVFKPLKEHKIYDDRVVLKKKHSKFSEIGHPKKEKKVKKKVALSDKENETMQKMIAYVTDNRLRNVISKEGEIKDKKSLFRLMPKMKDDVMKDFTKDCEDEYKAVSKKSQGVFKKTLVDEVRKLLMKNEKSILKGDF